MEGGVIHYSYFEHSFLYLCKFFEMSTVFVSVFDGDYYEFYFNCKLITFIFTYQVCYILKKYTLCYF